MFRIKRKQKILKLLPEKDIITTLKDFGITEEEDGYTMVTLSVVDEKDITVDSNGGVIFRNVPSSLCMYEHNQYVYNALKDVYKNRQIIEIKLKSIDNQYILDFTDYNSVHNIFEKAKELGVEIANDKDLAKYAVTKMCPKKRAIILTKDLGEKAFKGSKTPKYQLKCFICYDMDLILDMKIRREK